MENTSKLLIRQKQYEQGEGNATQSSILVWEIPWTEGPGGLWSMGFQKIRRDLEIKWRRKWQPTPVSLSGESCGQRSLVGSCPWGLRELDRTEVT